MSAEQTVESAQVSEVERVALDLASSVFGWQHLARYSGMSADWMDLTLLAIVRSALAAQDRVSRPAPHCDTCSDIGRIDWMVEADPSCSQEPDDEGKVPCPDCVIRPVSSTPEEGS